MRKIRKRIKKPDPRVLQAMQQAAFDAGVRAGLASGEEIRVLLAERLMELEQKCHESYGLLTPARKLAS